MEATTSDACAKTDVKAVAKADAKVAFDAGVEQPAKESTPEVASGEKKKRFNTDASQPSHIDVTAPHSLTLGLMNTLRTAVNASSKTSAKATAKAAAKADVEQAVESPNPDLDSDQHEQCCDAETPHIADIEVKASDSSTPEPKTNMFKPASKPSSKAGAEGGAKAAAVAGAEAH